MRLPGYDYSLPGYYFVTICTKHRQGLFGIVRNERMHPHAFGKSVRRSWLDLPNHYSCVLDAFVVMPNHVHGIVVIPGGLTLNPAGAGLNPRLRGGDEEKVQHPLTEIIRGFKTFSAAAVNRLRGTPGATLWQRSFHEHVLRTERDIDRVREYIRRNPEQWEIDSKNPNWKAN